MYGEGGNVDNDEGAKKEEKLETKKGKRRGEETCEINPVCKH